MSKSNLPEPAGLPADQSLSKAEASHHVIVSSSQSFVSPLPPPEILSAYEKTLPGITERILVSFEKEGDHRRASEKFQQELVQDYQNNHFFLMRRGQLCGMLVVILGLAVAAFLGWAGRQVVAGIVAALDLVGLASVFLYSQYKSKEDSETKSKA